MTEFAKPDGGLIKMPNINQGVSNEFNGMDLKQLAIYNSDVSTSVSRQSKRRNFFSASETSYKLSDKPSFVEQFAILSEKA